MSPSRWPRSRSHGKCSSRYCGSLRNCGRSHHQRQRETFDGHAFKSNRRQECAQMPRENGQIRHSNAARTAWNAESHPHRASALHPVQETAIIPVCPGLIRGIPVESSSMTLIHGLKRRIKRLIYGPPLPELDARIYALEQVFRSPPMPRSLARAVRLISPHLDLPPNERGRRLWQADQNGACWTEFSFLRDQLRALPKRARVLEIGPGLGRSLVFFSKKLEWQNYDLHAYEGDGRSTKYTVNGPRFENSWCGTISELRKVLGYNDIHNVKIHDADKVAMRHLPGPFDLVFGFYNIGFHWSLEHFMPEVLALIGSHGVAIFTVPREFKPFAALARLPHRLIVKESITSPAGEQLLIFGPQNPID